jgi:hypothetical protein
MRLLAKILISLLVLAGFGYLYYTSEKQHQMLINKFGLTAPDPYFFTVYERAVPLAGNLAAHFDQVPADTAMACAAQPNTTPDSG